MRSPTEFPWPTVIRVEPLEGRRLRVILSSGQQLLLDLTGLLGRREAYWRLRHPRYFRQVAIDPLGGLCWPEGEDLAPDGLDRYAIHSSLAEPNLEAESAVHGDGAAAS
jgi:hypothetical protein